MKLYMICVLILSLACLFSNGDSNEIKDVYNKAERMISRWAFKIILKLFKL